jgi:hypothetical protein
MAYGNANAQGTGAGYNYVSYYDDKYKMLQYWSSRQGANSEIAIDDPGTASLANDPVQAGEYNAIDLTSGLMPVIAYMAKGADGTERVKYAYVNATANSNALRQNPNSATYWSTAYVHEGNQYTTNAGRYISMRIDRATNEMHIAFMHSGNGDLIYVHGTPNLADTATGNHTYTFDPPIVIDSVGNVGKWTEITLDEKGMPYISYLDQAGIDSNTGLKMAFYNTAISTAATANQKPGTDLSGWEYVTLPGRYAVNDVRTQIEYDTRAARTWNAALAYVSGNDYRISYYIK